MASAVAPGLEKLFYLDNILIKQQAEDVGYISVSEMEYENKYKVSYL